jgi:hypothetical protein
VSPLNIAHGNLIPGGSSLSTFRVTIGALEAVNAMLLNEFLKEHRKTEEQEAIINRLQEQIEALSAGLQKVSAQVELSKSAPQTVLNDH